MKGNVRLRGRIPFEYMQEITDKEELIGTAVTKDADYLEAITGGKIERVFMISDPVILGSTYIRAGMDFPSELLVGSDLVESLFYVVETRGDNQ